MYFRSASILFFSLGLITLDSQSFGQTTANSDSIALAKKDSIRLHQKEIQASIHREFDALTRFQLGDETYAWSHTLEMEITRAGRSYVQRFWFNPKKMNPIVWLPDTSRSNEFLFYDSNTDRLASIFPEDSSGTLIPSQMAAKMGLTGNSSQVAARRLSLWQKQESDSLLTYVMDDGASFMETQFGEKSKWQANGVNKWLSMQPIPGFVLPSIADKQPIVFFEQTNKADIVRYSFRLLDAALLDEPFTIDLTTIRANDPTKSLNVLAKEWADKNKKKTVED